MEWINNILLWLKENINGIVAFLSSGTVIGCITNIIMILRQGKNISNTLKSTDTLNTSLYENKKVLISVDSNTKSVNELKESVENSSTVNQNLLYKIGEFDIKLTAVLEVMNIVYSTIKDDTIRNTVSNIITNAKYAETSTRANLEKQLTEMRNKLEEGTKNLLEHVEEEMDKADKIINPSTDKNISLRY